MTDRDWDDAFDNRTHAVGVDALIGEWPVAAAAYRASGVRIDTDIAYGSSARQKLDIIWPDRAPKGLAMFVHGGYWMAFDKSNWTQFAKGARDRGWAVAIPSYTLAPQAKIHEMTAEIVAALDHAAQMVDGPIRLAGHSAGGHLVSRFACRDLQAACAGRIEHVLSISGLHDLRPLMATKMNETLHLNLAEARAESAALLEPRRDARLTAWVGGGERPEFIRQAQLLEIVWRSFDVDVSAVVDGIHNHFTVIEGLRDPNSDITQAFVT
ncbi:esterase [Actibacterium mucosum KCTC 23349]|uniref:Esterase n=1 Tax=Actibacterium mucosum KCTC 23349 TaxID=1454373 RepID=A0A037ZLW5_9RHOB|nr:alpha/beta hydrolase [Actibacterium mucosum]KAJ55821.1 esterase [Actibacterium mucosum KCTC 23349]